MFKRFQESPDKYYDPVIDRFINTDGYSSTGQGFLDYNMSKVRIAETGIWIYPDTVLRLKQSNPIGLEGNAIHIEFNIND